VRSALERSLRQARDLMSTWIDRFPEPAQAALKAPEAAAELTRRSYVDGYLRIRETTPLILHAIDRFNALRKRREAEFWIGHLSEECFHDQLMRKDLVNMLGGAGPAAAVLRKARITPPSAALLGYFEWQVAVGDPTQLIALRLFLEWYLSGIEKWRVAHVNALVPGGSQIMLTHQQLDEGHCAECFDYAERFCRGNPVELDWSILFVGRCLADAHAFLARDLLERRG
jgi:hypothetical protein